MKKKLDMVIFSFHLFTYSPCQYLNLKRPKGKLIAANANTTITRRQLFQSSAAIHHHHSTPRNRSKMSFYSSTK